MARKVGLNYIEYGGRRFHERAEPDAYELALSMMEEGGAPTGRALDLAAGAGYTSARLAEMGLQVNALDIHTEQFVPDEVTIQKADLNEPIPFDDDTFQAVLALEVIEHLENPRGFLREIGRVLEPGGRLVLSTPNIVALHSKLRWLFRSEFELFLDQSNRVRDTFCEEADGHITPIVPWLLRIFLSDGGLRLDKTDYTKRYWMRNRHTSRSMIVSCTKT